VESNEFEALLVADDFIATLASAAAEHHLMITLSFAPISFEENSDDRRDD